MGNEEPSSMEMNGSILIGSSRSVFYVPFDRHPSIRKLNADLMVPPGLRENLQQSIPIPLSDRFIA